MVLAVYVMQELDPRRFRSDPGFRFQLVRRVRALADVNAGQRWDDKAEKVRRVYRELTPRAVATMGQWLAEALAGRAFSSGDWRRAISRRRSRRSRRCGARWRR